MGMLQVRILDDALIARLEAHTAWHGRSAETELQWQARPVTENSAPRMPIQRCSLRSDMATGATAGGASSRWTGSSSWLLIPE